MLTSLVLSMTLAAPVPADAPTPATGPAPRLLELKPGADGKIMVVATQTEKVEIGRGNAIAPPGGAAPAVITREVSVARMVELGAVKNLTVTTADGKKVDTADALKKLEKGGVVVVSADGKPVSPAFLKLFRDDVLVLASPELLAAPAAVGAIGRPGGIRPLPVEIQPLPAVQPALPPVRVQPGVIQIEVAPLPAKPLPVVPDKK